MSADEDRLTVMLGEAVKCRWGDLPQEVQHLLFEEALTTRARDEEADQVREQLALLLHHHHPRTAAPK